VWFQRLRKSDSDGGENDWEIVGTFESCSLRTNSITNWRRKSIALRVLLMGIYNL